MKSHSLLALAVFGVLLGAVLGTARTIDVGGFLDDYDDIQAALDDAGTGDTVNVAEGTYKVSDGIKINTPGVVLMGAGAAETVLDGDGEAYAVIKVQAQRVTITGFTLRGGSSHGVYVNDSNWAIIDRNVITANDDRGILLGMGKPSAIVTNNTIVDNDVSAVYSYRDEPKTKFINNVIVSNGRGLVCDTDIKKMAVEYNCFWDQSTDSAQVRLGKGNLRADPRFADQSGGDYRLAAGSPCIGKGQNGRDIGALGRAPTGTAPAATGSRTELAITIFAADTGIGGKVLRHLRNAGFTNSANFVTGSPNSEAGIKYGARTAGMIPEIVKLVANYYSKTLKQENVFEAADREVFVNLP
jgi:nitrous oxidase accessory protein NosD